MNALPRPVLSPAALLLLLALLLLPSGARAQATLSIDGGVSFASLQGDDVPNQFGTRTGFVAGARLGIPVGDIFSVAPGLYYAQKGADIETSVGTGALRLDYIEVPVLGVFMVTAPQRPMGVSLFFGPSFAFEVSCEREGTIAGVTATADCDDDSDRRKFDLGAIFGAGLSFPLTDRVALGVNGGLNIGLRSLDGSASSDDVKNQAYFLMAGLSFPLGR